MNRMLRFAPIAVTMLVMATLHHTAAQTAPSSGGPVDSAVIDDLVAAYRILADQAVLDILGHVSIRHPKNSNRYLISRQMAPALVTENDIMEFDLDSNPVNQDGRGMWGERFIHGEIYKARSDVNAVVHTHSPGVVPFTTTQTPLRAIHQVGAFLGMGAVVFETRGAAPNVSGVLVRNAALGKALAATLGDKPVILLRGHGDVLVGTDVKIATGRAIGAEVNARMQATAMQLGGSVNYFSEDEAAAMDALNAAAYSRAWELWKKNAMTGRQ